MLVECVLFMLIFYTSSLSSCIGVSVEVSADARRAYEKGTADRQGPLACLSSRACASSAGSGHFCRLQNATGMIRAMGFGLHSGAMPTPKRWNKLRELRRQRYRPLLCKRRRCREPASSAACLQPARGDEEVHEVVLDVQPKGLLTECSWPRGHRQEDVATIHEATPGPDGLLHALWRRLPLEWSGLVHELGERMASGGDAPRWMLASRNVYIPRALQYRRSSRSSEVE